MKLFTGAINSIIIARLLSVPVLYASQEELPLKSEQHVVVAVEHNNSTTGLLYCYSKQGTAWKKSGPAIPVVVGLNGVDKTCEGDRRAPQGIYNLSFAFGIEPQKPEWLDFPYRGMFKETECVDDAGSPYYNKIVNPSEIKGGKNWKSSEKMRRDIHNGDNLYKYGIMVEYNPEGQRDPASGKGAGSCIFLHIWRSSKKGTYGCTAMSEQNLIWLMKWLNASAQPVLIQGSRKYLDELRLKGIVQYEIPKP